MGFDLSKLELVKRGKVKDIYLLDNERLLFHFTDRVSAFDVVLPSTIPFKGEVLCRMAAFWFRYLEDRLGVEHHMLRVEPPNFMVVRRMEMIPIEFVVRGYIYGSLYERMLRGEVNLPVEPVLAAKLPEPILDPTTKFEEKDRPITRGDAIARGWVTPSEYDRLKDLSIDIYEAMRRRAEEAGFILADLKIEFGRYSGRIILGDSIGPDEFRLWVKSTYSPGRFQDSFDKQPVRDWLDKVGYRNRLDEARRRGEPTPEPPNLPRELIEEVSRRYIEAYERLSGERFR
ncbi:MAG: phosphoribosylaminoimidazolesuccinocarboxamide synthase [Nitrososphaerota archaeon]|nr:phosphoribosylaminoimidazolesuccinocarboxamide synthase [Candidatus Bathyarchaeota archaeon]MDW8062022.1 phosphoribosylaminoimidazolesuccinocarboxamide synthase [Nitrososphaerota archaeon]